MREYTVLVGRQYHPDGDWDDVTEDISGSEYLMQTLQATWPMDYTALPVEMRQWLRAAVEALEVDEDIPMPPTPGSEQRMPPVPKEPFVIPDDDVPF